MTDVFEDIDLDFDEKSGKQEVVSEETPLDSVQDEIDFSELDEQVSGKEVKDEVEEILKDDPKTEENKVAELDKTDLDLKSPIDDLSNLDIEMENKPKEEKPKKEKKPRQSKAKKEEKPVEENLDDLGDILGDIDIDQDNTEKENIIQEPEDELPPEPTLPNRKIYLDPELNIEYLEKSTYQTRSVSRRPEEIEELATLIRRQGQLEPIHVVVKGDVKYLVAGFGRVAAMSLLKMTTAKAIVYENITEEEILKISSGTNTGRLELREWDKISSVGQYAVKNPTVDIKKFPQIFGFEKSSIYDYISIFNFFKDKKEYIEFFNKIPLPQFMFKSLMKNVREFPQISPKKILDYVEAALNYDKTTATKFNYELVEMITKEKAKLDTINKEKEFDKLEIEDGISEKDVKGEVNDKLRLAVEQHKHQSNEKTQIAIAHCISIVKSLENICAVVEELQKMEDYKKIIPSTTVNTVCKKLSEVQIKVANLV